MLVTQFEDLEIWQVSRELANEVYKLTYSKPFSQDLSLKDQVRRSAVSVMANIAEGFGRKSKNEFIQFLRYSLASAAETKSHLYLALDLKYISQDQFFELENKIVRIIKQTKSFIKKLNYK